LHTRRWFQPPSDPAELTTFGPICTQNSIKEHSILTTRNLLFTLLGAPLDCTGRFTGVERMPAALRHAGLTKEIPLKDAGDLPIAIADPQRDAATGIIGFADLQAATLTLRDAVGDLLRSGQRPLVLGGCCSLLIGVAAALRDVYGRIGLAFVDGHLDFYDGSSSPTGEAADMELAILTGVGPAGLVDVAGSPPLVEPASITVLGFRDEAEAAAFGAPNPRTVAPKMALYDAETLRRYGCAAAGAGVEERFRFDPGHFWLHLDLDVLDENELPAVDYPMPGGLTWAQVAELVRPLAVSPALVGMDVTIYNPALDPEGVYAHRIVTFLQAILAAG
jgi:arginase